jgi:hypothetical protein
MAEREIRVAVNARFRDDSLTPEVETLADLREAIGGKEGEKLTRK